MNKTNPPKRPQQSATVRRSGRGAAKSFWQHGNAWVSLSVTALLFAVVAWSARVDATPKEEKASNQKASHPAASASTGRAKGAWHTNYAAAQAEAAQTNKPILLRFTAAWCMPCQVMDTNVWPDAQVKAALAKHAVPAKIDVDEQANAELARRYGIRTIPTLLLVDANGDELARGAFMGAEALVQFLQQR